MEPTILADVEDHMMVAKEESFGPVMVISSFETGYSDVLMQQQIIVFIVILMGSLNVLMLLNMGQPLVCLLETSTRLLLTMSLPVMSFFTAPQALYVSDNIDAGTVFVNTYNKTDVAAPFGGFKQSGFGKDLGQCCYYDLSVTFCWANCITVDK